MGEVVEDQETIEGWEFNEVFDACTWVTYFKEGDIAADVFGWRWFEDRENFTEGWVEVLPSGFFRGLRYWDLFVTKPLLIQQTLRWFWVEGQWVKAAFNRRHDGSVCSHPVLGVALFVDYRSRLHGMCTLYWDDASQWWATKGLWLSVVEDI